MTTILSALDVGQYIRGNIAQVPNQEPDPFENWPEFAEHNAHDLRSVRLDGELVGVVGYFLFSATEAYSFAVIDRQAVRGVGPALCAAIRKRQIQWMEEIGVKRAHADTGCQDRAAQVFLRAIGYRRVDGPDSDRRYFIFDWS